VRRWETSLREGEIAMTWQELKAIALANPKGKIVSGDATGNDVNNIGSWQTVDIYRDIQEDVEQAIKRLNSKPSYLIGGHDSLKGVCLTIDPYRESKFVYESLAPMFWFSTDKFPNYEMTFIRFDDAADPGIVLLVGSEGDVVYIDTR
jgi:hypothetical protein